jgi:hypothetical protein
MVMRDDAVNGQHRDEYAYDPVSGRLVSVTDTVPEPDVVHQFAWNPEGTLARWEEPNSYARVFGYDEEGRLVKIERDYGSGGVQLAYEYGYNSDGVRVWKRDVLAGQEYRYVCRLRIYYRAVGERAFSVFYTMLVGPTFKQIENRIVLNWVAGEETVYIEQPQRIQFEFIYRDRFFNIYYYNALQSGVRQKCAEWREEPTCWGLAYSHAWIEFSEPCVEKNQNAQQKRVGEGIAWGFWPKEAPSILDPTVPGEINPNDSYQGRGKVVKKITDPLCVRALCECVLDSKKNPPSYCVPFYTCGSWVSDMFLCAEERAGKDCDGNGYIGLPPRVPPSEWRPGPTGPCGGKPCP